MSREGNRTREGLERQIPNFPKRGRRPGNYKEQAAARHRWVKIK